MHYRVYKPANRMAENIKNKYTKQNPVRMGSISEKEKFTFGVR